MAGAIELIDHVCATCLGRIARRLDDPTAFVCTSCGVSCRTSPAAICGCGVTIVGLRESQRVLREHRGRLRLLTETVQVTKPRAVGFRCCPNPAPGPLSPALIVIALGAPETIVLPMSDAAAASQ